MTWTLFGLTLPTEIWQALAILVGALGLPALVIRLFNSAHLFDDRRVDAGDVGFVFLLAVQGGALMYAAISLYAMYALGGAK